MTDRRQPSLAGRLASALGEPTASEMIRTGVAAFLAAYGPTSEGAAQDIVATVLLGALEGLDGTELLDTVPLEERTDALAVHLGAALTRRLADAEQRGRDAARTGQAPDGKWHYVVHCHSATTGAPGWDVSDIRVRLDVPLTTYARFQEVRQGITAHANAPRPVIITGVTPLPDGE